MQLAHPALFWPIVTLMSFACLFDLRSRRIPDPLTLPFLGAGLFISALTGGWSGAERSFAGALLGVAVPGIFCYLGGMGGGDMKLCAAAGAWLGFSQLAVALVLTGLAGGVMAVVWSAARGRLGETLRGTGDLLGGAREGHSLDSPRACSIPYAPAIAFGAICSFLGG